MNKTIAPFDKTEHQGLSSNETVGPAQALTSRDVLKDPNTPRLTPSFFVYEKNRVNCIEIPADESIFRIGKSETCDVTLNDNMISDTQITVIKMGGYCYFMDCGTKDRVAFNGVKKRQLVVPIESRVVMKVGNTWIVYLGLDGNLHEDTDSIILKRSLLASHNSVETSDGEILIKSNFGEWYSSSAPILVGTHNVCDYQISGENIQPFHFIIFFSPQGPFIEELTHGRPGITVNGLNSIGSSPMKNDITVSIGKLSIYIYLYGNMKEHCEELFKGLNPCAELALTPLSTKNATPIALPKTNERLSIGRLSECNIIIPDDPSISRLHAYINIRDKSLQLTDNNSHNKTYVNLKPISKKSVLPGDIIEFGDSSYLLHYQS
jgi:pSer/pThr/pTyr-binding forkhead associated (FHA) protein